MRYGNTARLDTEDEWPTAALVPLQRAYSRGFGWAAPPIGLWVRGERPMSKVFDRAVAVVGRRAASPYGEHVATDLAYEVARAGVTVVSGAAFGIDDAAHRGALAGRGLTVAFLGCAVDVAYPSAHTDLLKHIAAHGLLVSQYPPGTRPSRQRFLVRNRLTAAMVAATVVVESAVRGGTRHTAAVAGVLGTPVLAVPGPITSIGSRGCHELLRGGQATFAETAADVLAAVDTTDEHRLAAMTAAAFAADLRAAHHVLSTTETPEAQLAARCGIAPARLRLVLQNLALIRSAARGETGWHRI